MSDPTSTDDLLPHTVRCNGSARYAIRCRNRTNHASGLCYLHRYQVSLDVRGEPESVARHESLGGDQ